MALLPDASIDLTVTSPPYDNLREYNGYTFDFEAIAAQLWRVTKPGGVVVWVVGDATVNGSETGTSFRQALRFMELGFNLYDTMFYHRFNGVPTEGRYYDVIEYMFILSKGKPSAINFLNDRKNLTAGNRERKDTVINKGKAKEKDTGSFVTQKYGRRTNLWYCVTGDNRTGHPAPFPEALARDHILSWSNPGDLVLDPMCGSGTTGKMAVLTGRRFIGIDISEEYVELSRERIAKALQQPRLFTADTPAEAPAAQQGGLW